MDKLRKSHPFPFAEEAAAFSRQHSEVLKLKLAEIRAQYISPENELAYRHGRQWQSHHSFEPDEISTMRAHEFSYEISTAAIAAGDIELLERSISEVASGLHRSFADEFYNFLAATCDKSGNSLTEENLTPAQQFLSGLRAIEFGVDHNGQAVLPSFHLGADAFNSMISDLGKQGPDFHEQVEETKRQKINAALNREEARRGRFVKRHD